MAISKSSNGPKNLCTVVLSQSPRKEERKKARKKESKKEKVWYRICDLFAKTNVSLVYSANKMSN